MTGVLGEELTGLYIGRCPTCRTVLTREELQPWYYPLNMTCPCGRQVKVKPVVGKHSDKKSCGPRCTSATGPNCECPCAGKLHGSDHH